MLPIPSEASWSLGINKRSHRYIHKSIDRLILERNYSVGPELEVLLPNVEVGWNSAQHNNNVLSHYHRFGVMPCIVGSLDNLSRLNERIALMELARRETDQLRAEDFIIRVLHPFRRNVNSLRSFTANEKVWFYRNRDGWRVGIVAAIEKPIITVSYDGKMFPTYENRIRPYFGELSIPPELHDEQQREDPPTTDAETPTPRRIPLSDPLNPVFAVSGQHSEENFQMLPVASTSYCLIILNFKTFQIDSDEVFLTVTRTIKGKEQLSETDHTAMKKES